MPGRHGPAAFAMGEQGVDQRAVRIAGCGMDDEAGGLVDHDDGVILEQNIERHCLRFRFRRFRRGQGDGAFHALFDSEGGVHYRPRAPGAIRCGDAHLRRFYQHT